MKYTSLRVREDRQLKLERAAIEISSKIGKTVKWTDVANILFDEYLNDAKEDIKAQRNPKALKK